QTLKLDRAESDPLGKSQFFNLAVTYYTGKGAPKDRREAVRWFKRASDSGDALSSYNLAVLYRDGDGVDADPAESLKWFSKAANSGNADAALHLGWLYQTGTEVPLSTTRARLWYEKALDTSTWVRNNYAVLQAYGEGVPEDTKAAMFSFQVVSQKDLTVGYLNVGLLYELGIGRPVDYPEAVKWYTKGVQAGDGPSENQLAVMYEKGIGVPQDLNEAARLHQKAAEAGDAMGQANLGLHYLSGKG